MTHAVLDLQLETVGDRSLLGLVFDTYLAEACGVEEAKRKLPPSIGVRLLHLNNIINTKRCCQLIRMLSADVARLAEDGCIVYFVD